MSNKGRRRQRQPRGNNFIEDEVDEAPRLRIIETKQEQKPIRHLRNYTPKDWSTKPKALAPRHCPYKHVDDIVCPMCSGFPVDD